MYDSIAVQSAGQSAGVLGATAALGAGANGTGLATTGTSVAALCIVAALLIIVGFAFVRRSKRIRTAVEA